MGHLPARGARRLFVPGAEATLHGLVRSAGVEVQLESPLMTVVRMVGSADTARPEAVELACQHIAHWADGHGYSATAVAFAQAAAMTVPFDAGAAYAVGRIAKRRAEYSRAETWYRRAIALARQSGDWSSYALAFSGLGNLYMQRGSFPAARRFHLRALKAARRHSLRSIQGSAQHDLFVIAAGHTARTRPSATPAAPSRATGPSTRGWPRWPTTSPTSGWSAGTSSPALTVFEALPPHMARHEDRLVALANIVRAAAGAGERRQFEQMWDEVWDGLARDEATENAAQVLLELAHGAAQLGETERAERAAERAVRTARERGESKTLLTAEAVVDSVRRTRAARGRPADTPREQAPEETELFATDLVRSLNASLVTQ